MEATNDNIQLTTQGHLNAGEDVERGYEITEINQQTDKIMEIKTESNNASRKAKCVCIFLILFIIGAAGAVYILMFWRFWEKEA